MRTIIVVGGGASGMAAAIAAAEQSNTEVILLERQQRLGRKLLSTGNGRCNLTNRNAGPDCYHGEDPKFTGPVLAALPPEKILEWFARQGLLTQTEYGGRVYPYSNTANSVVDILRLALERTGVQIHTACPVEEARKEGKRFAVRSGTLRLEADALIVACGGLAGGKLGGVPDGSRILSSLGHSRTPLAPALTQITTDPTYPRALKGIRAEASLQLTGCAGGKTKGEILFTEKGISGPAAFDLSRAVAVAGEGEKQIHADFFPDWSREDLFCWIARRQKTAPRLPAQDLLLGLLHNKLGRMLVRYAGLPAQKPAEALAENDLRCLCDAAKDFALPVRGTGGYDGAQVTAGGVRTGEFDPATLESRRVSGLYACGEVLDVDGDCGGYNLQWAWASGIAAGRAAAEERKRQA